MPEGTSAHMAQIHDKAGKMFKELFQHNADFETWKLSQQKGDPPWPPHHQDGRLVATPPPYPPGGVASSYGRADDEQQQDDDDSWGNWGGGKGKGTEHGKGKKGKGKNTGKDKDKGKEKNNKVFKSHGGNLKNIVKFVQICCNEGQSDEDKMKALTIMANDLWDKRSADFQKVWDGLPALDA